MENLKPLHQKELKKNFTNFGLKADKNNLSEYFNNNPKESKVYLDYQLFDSPEDHYYSDFINTNSI